MSLEGRSGDCKAEGEQRNRLQISSVRFTTDNGSRH